MTPFPIGNQQRRGTSSAEILAGVMTSLFLHGLILGVAVLSVVLGGHDPEEESEFVEVIFEEVELLAFGEIRNPDELPRLSADAPAVVDEVRLDVERPEEVPEPPPEPEVDLEARERERERREQLREEERRQAAEDRERRRQEALARAQGTGGGVEMPEGSPEGVIGGTVSDAALADMRATYQVRIRQELERVWEVPMTISADELERLAGQVRVAVRINDVGHITSYRFLDRSENPQFDDSIERALQRFQRDRGGRTLPLPEQSELRSEVLRGGMSLSNWKVMQR